MPGAVCRRPAAARRHQALRHPSVHDARPGGGLVFSTVVLGGPSPDQHSRYTIFSRADGTGFSQAGSVALTTGAQPEPGTRDGLLFYVRDLDAGTCWRLGNPAGGSQAAGSTYENGVVRLDHRQDDIEASLTTCVVPGRRAELRRLVLVNRSSRPRRLDVTSLAEIVLNEPAAHAAHPGFSKLFIQTEAEPALGAILARRRQRSPQESWPVLVHVLAGEGPLQWETDRLQWRGRGRHRDEPAALAPGAILGGNTGNVLDPVASLRRGCTLAPDATATFTFLLGVGDDRTSALALAQLAADPAAVGIAFAGAAARAASDVASRGWTPAEDTFARELAAAILEGDPRLRAPAGALARGEGTRPALAKLGLGAGDALVVVRSADRVNRKRLHDWRPCTRSGSNWACPSGWSMSRLPRAWPPATPRRWRRSPAWSSATGCRRCRAQAHCSPQRRCRPGRVPRSCRQMTRCASSTAAAASTPTAANT
jgi:hypothetical protein